VRPHRLAELLVGGQAHLVECRDVQLDEPLALLLDDLQPPVHGDEVGEVQLAAEAIRPAEGLAREGGQVVDMVRAASAEQRLQHRVGEHAAVEGVLETVEAGLAPGVIELCRHASTLQTHPPCEPTPSGRCPTQSAPPRLENAMAGRSARTE
jgi:hypothetical protein